ncbi:MAG: hypothetical protein K2X87_19200 [Gemmataceae bacterium]|nr:hypothetical protein [Gemmataceae bacterium]
MTRTVTCLLLLVGMLVLATTADKVFAQPPPPPWEWSTYKTGVAPNQVTWSYPEWQDMANPLGMKRLFYV